MDIRPLEDRLHVSPQILPEEVQTAAAQGYRAIISNRPDAEEPGQPMTEDIRAAAEAAGIARARLVVDPGFGFGKNREHNLELLRMLPSLHAADIALLAGLSRKSMLGAITGRPVGERAAASVTAALIAVQRGARIVRVHDVAATRDALTVWQAVEGAQR